MIRFIDLTEDYWTSPEDGGPCCAFLDTVTDKFVANGFGCHVFDEMRDIDDIEDAGLREHCARLLPEGFFDGRWFGTLISRRVESAIDTVPIDGPTRVAAASAVEHHEVTKLLPTRPPWVAQDKPIGRKV